MTSSGESEPVAPGRVGEFEARFGMPGAVRQSAELSIQLIDAVEHQRLELYDTLLGLTQENRWECDQFIKKAQSEPQKLGEDCLKRREEVKWSPDMPKSAVKDGPAKHSQACLQDIACLELMIRDLYEIQAMDGSSGVPGCLFFFPGEAHIGWSWVVWLFARASEHLAAVRVLNEWEQYLEGRRRGGVAKGSSTEGKLFNNLIHALVKGLIQESEDSKRAHSRSNLELADRCCAAITDLWKDRPIFHFDEANIKGAVVDSLIDFGKVAKRQKTSFELRRRPVSFRVKPDGLSREARELKAWQDGIALALVEVLEGRFGAISDQEYALIESASPELLAEWLRRAGTADSVKRVLNVT